jgi:hypothetical protein
MPSAFDVAPVGPTSGGKVYAFNNLGTTPEVVAPANPARASIRFDNQGTVDVIIFPCNVQALNPSWVATSTLQGGVSGSVNLSNVALSPNTTTLGGGYRIFANGGFIIFAGECQGSFQALAITGSGNPLTVTDSNT